MPGTIGLHRVLRAPAERVYRAFRDPQALVKRLPPQGFTATVHSMDARVGGGCRKSVTNFGSGKSHSFGCRYLELVPGERRRYVDQFDDPNLPGGMNVTVSPKAVPCGTGLSIVQDGIPEEG